MRAFCKVDAYCLTARSPTGGNSCPLDIRVQLIQGDLTTEFDATAELVEVPRKKEHIIRLMDESSEESLKGSSLPRP